MSKNQLWANKVSIYLFYEKDAAFLLDDMSKLHFVSFVNKKRYVSNQLQTFSSFSIEKNKINIIFLYIIMKISWKSLLIIIVVVILLFRLAFPGMFPLFTISAWKVEKSRLNTLKKTI